MSYLSNNLIKYSARICWDYPALIDLEDKVYTYGELYKRSNRLANALLGLGLKKGDRVGIWSVDCKEYIEYFWACDKIGVVYMFSAIAPVYPDEWIEKLINKSDVKAFFVHENYLERFIKIRPKLEKVEKIIVIGSKGSVPSDMYHYETLINEYPDSEPKLGWELLEDECAFTAFSGGTTGIPKIIEHRRFFAPWTYSDVIPRIIVRNLLPKILNAPRRMFEELSEVFNSPYDEIFLETITDPSVRESLISTLQHMGDLHSSILMKILPRVFRGKLRFVVNPLSTSWGAIWQQICHTLGGCVVLSKGLLDVRDYLYRLTKHKAHVLAGIGFPEGELRMKRALTEEPSRYDLSSMKVSVTLGFTPEFKKWLLKIKPHFMVEMITSSEAGLPAMNVYWDPNDEEIDMNAFYLNPDAGVINDKNEWARPGEEGRLVISGKYCLMGYYKEPEKEKEAFIVLDGKRWYISGERGMLDEKGRFRMFAAEALIARVAGKDVSLRDVGRRIAEHPAVEVAGCLPVPDEVTGQAIVVAVELKKGMKLTEEELREYCKKVLKEHEVPKYFVFLEEVPRTRYGSISYGELRKLLKGRGFQV
jgi:acyl-coenzyme A synthetase/AMP-(fatty) acid ligase